MKRAFKSSVLIGYVIVYVLGVASAVIISRWIFSDWPNSSRWLAIFGWGFGIFLIGPIFGILFEALIKTRAKQLKSSEHPLQPQT